MTLSLFNAKWSILDIVQQCNIDVACSLSVCATLHNFGIRHMQFANS